MIIKTIPVGVVNLLIFTIQQIVAKKYVKLKNDELFIKNVSNNKSTHKLGVHFLFYNYHMYIINCFK